MQFALTPAQNWRINNINKILTEKYKTEIKILANPGLALLGFDHLGEYKWVPPARTGSLQQTIA